ncbi:DNA-binding protein [Sporosarcina pasteurii]|uniref:DNA-binding protein n=1 Tax=Sporosarcina pasteurii TaxID=1474 RepID=A0A380CM68_SPOPA|nr:DNA-binding protein [Sporosarcina pasteurii]MDS9471945.1 DNA-binding protein [Sporosarcina pasteurii]QBQ06676.1 DNA-binding protein [Sporosarcina pasteurii]SUJ21918.1 Uncharacterised protein [Sporosarcina pasteurii]
MTHEQTDLPKLAKPALRALAGAGISKLDELAKYREEEVMDLHGMGPKAMAVLQQAMEENGVSFLK